MPALTRTFRVFVSSSFADRAPERRALNELAFRPLADECTRRGASFQAVDLRWGISPEASLDQRTMAVCLEEVERCRRTSPELNFLFLSGDRRGWLPLPGAIPATDLPALQLRGAQRSLVEQWYRLDENARPPAFRLLPRVGRSIDREVWRAIETDLHGVLADAAERLSPERRRIFQRSATEQEVDLGILGTPSVAGAFAVLSPEGHLDEAVRACLPAGQIVDQPLTPHEVAGTVHELFAARIDEALSGSTVHRRPAPPPAPPLVGRDRELEILRRFTSATGSGLMAVRGEPGTGKTALLSAAAARSTATATATASTSDLTLIRLLGTTRRTGDIAPVLEDLVLDLGRALGRPDRLTSGYAEAVSAFDELLTGTDRPIRLYFDALDQLSADGRPDSLRWLPDPLPANVRVVVSALPGVADQALLARRAENLVLQGLSVDDGSRLLEEWLTGAGRTLSAPQAHRVLDRFAVEGRPLWLRLAVEEARRWTSDDQPTDLPPTLGALIDTLFTRLGQARNHGPTLITHVIGLIAAAGEGISDDELLTALSLDDGVLAEVRERSHPAWRAEIDTVPPVLWAQVRSDLEGYLTQREDAGRPLLAFYHRELNRRSARTSGADLPDRHRDLAQVFERRSASAGAWLATDPRALEQLPIHLRAADETTRLTTLFTDLRYLQSVCLSVGVAEAVDNAGRPYQRFGGARLAARWMSSAGADPLVSSLAAALAAEADQLSTRPQLFWQQVGGRLRDGGTAQRALADAEARRRLDSGEGAWFELRTPRDEPAGQVQLLRAQDRGSDCALSRDGTLLVTGGWETTGHLWDARDGSLLAALPGHESRVRCCAVAPDGTKIVTGDSGGTLRHWLWDGLRAELRAAVVVGTGQVESCSAGHDGLVAVATSGGCYVWRPGWAAARRLPGPGDARSCAVAAGAPVVVAGYQDGSVRRWSDLTAEPAVGGERHDGAVYACAVDHSGRRAVTGTGRGDLKVWSAELRTTGPPISPVAPDSRTGVFGVAVDDDFRQLVVAHTGGIVRVHDLADGHAVAAFRSHAGDAMAVTTTAEGDAAASIGMDGMVRVWRPGPQPDAQTDELFGRAVQLTELRPAAGQLVAVDAYGFLRVVDTRTGLAGPPVATVPTFCVDVTVDGDVLSVLEWEGPLHVWRLDPVEKLRELTHAGAVACLAVDGGTVVTAARDGSLIGWEAFTGEQLWRTTTNPGRPGLAGGAGLLVVSAAGGVDLFDPRTGARRQRLRPPGDDDVYVSTVVPQGDQSLIASGTAGGRVLIWRWDGQRAVEVAQPEQHSEGVMHLASGPSSRPVISAGADGRVGLWSSAGGPVRWLDGHGTTVRWVQAMSSTGDLVVSCAEDKTVRVWSSRTGAEVALLPLAGRGATVSSTGDLVAVGDDGGRVYLATLRGTG